MSVSERNCTWKFGSVPASNPYVVENKNLLHIVIIM